MSATVFITRMPAGIPGDVVNKETAKIEPNIMDSTTPVTLYGVPVKMESEKIKPIEAADTASEVYGFSVRPFPIQPTANAALSVAVPPTNMPLDVLRSGYLSVKNNAGTPAKGGAVYVRVVSSGLDAQPIGGIEAAADGSDCVAITGCTFMGTQDADGNVAIAYNI